MKLFVAAAALALTLGTSATLAADPPELVVDEPAFDWTGFYAGIYGLYGVGEVTDTYDGVTPFTFSIMGPGAGAQIGANVQMDNFVVGIRGNVAIAAITGTSLCDAGTTPACGGTGTDPTFTVDVLASTSLVLGYAVDTWLLYGTVGVGAAQGTLSDTLQGGTDTNWHRGLVAGIGIETSVTDNISLFGEVDVASYEAIGYDVVATQDIIAFGLVTAKAGINVHF